MALSFEPLRHALAQIAPDDAHVSAGAAVAIIFRVDQNRPQLLLIQRATRDDDPWSGHLAFPGGRRDADDPHLEATARRETLEEVGLNLSESAELLGQSTAITAQARRTPLVNKPPLIVVPYVYVCHRPSALHIDTEEVADAFWTDLPPLLSGELATHYAWKHGSSTLRFPGFQIGAAVLWGMSYTFLQPLSRRE